MAFIKVKIVICSVGSALVVAVLIGLGLYQYLTDHSGKNKENSYSCTRRPEWAGVLALGVDITQLDLENQNLFDNFGLKTPLYEFTCKEQTHFNGSIIPDQVSFTATKTSKTTTHAEIFRTLEDLERSKGLKIYSELGSDIYIPENLVSSSDESKMKKDKLLKKDVYIIEQFVDVTMGQGSVIWDKVEPDSIKPVRKFEDERENSTYESEPEEFNRFIDLYGTHVFTSAIFGGELGVRYEVEKKYFNTHSEDNAVDNVRRGFEKRIYGGNVSKDKEPRDKDFTRYSTHTIFRNGGYIFNGSLTNWEKSVDNYPTVLKGRFKRVSLLFKKKAIATEMDKAIDSYVLRAFVRQELKPIVDTWEGPRVKQYLEIKQKMAILLSGKSINMTEVEFFTELVNFHLKIPHDFQFKSRLCSNFKNKKQCGPVNKAYNGIDLLTEEKNFTCGMNWKWSKNVEVDDYEGYIQRSMLCLKADNTSHKSCQLKNLMECSKFNEFSSKMFQSSDKWEHCELSWKLQTPNNSPLWLQYLQLCFDWIFGDHEPSRVCVEANNWNYFYTCSNKRKKAPRSKSRTSKKSKPRSSGTSLFFASFDFLSLFFAASICLVLSHNFN